ncbi:MAG: FHA domain-containing protein [Synechococcales cyanobacterium T60_A2020_003]|nr:FHA domain-containing protein [Synechococcales cyanobacterium T60_A2020_003]
MPETSYVQLSWEDPVTGEMQCPLVAAPIAIGREVGQMPTQYAEQPVSQIELDHRQVSRFHALITVVNQQLCITDKSANGTFLNGRSLTQQNQPFSSGDTIRIGPYKITASLVREKDHSATELTIDPNANARKPSSQGGLIWLVGLVVLLLIGLGTWLAVTALLERSRPPLPQSSTSERSSLPL